MIVLLLTILSICSLAQDTTNTTAIPMQICITRDQQSFGDSKKGKQFSAYTSLLNDQYKYTVRLREILLCNSSAEPFAGLKISVDLMNAYNIGQYTTKDALSVGNTSFCPLSVQLDSGFDEFVRNVTFQYDATGIKWMNLSTSLNKSYVLGKQSATLKRQTFIYSKLRGLIGFWGTATNSSILSIGQVSVNVTCLPASPAAEII